MFINSQQTRRCENIGIKLRKVLKLRSRSFDTPLVLSIGFRVNNQINFQFCNAMHTQGMLTNSHKERRHENFKMGLKQIHKQSLKRNQFTQINKNKC
jgi:hypothetical protein